MKTEKITCDNCEHDLSATTNSIDYRLKLSNENMPIKSAFVTDMGIFPIIDSDKHFCGLGCLKMWINKEDK